MKGPHRLSLYEFIEGLGLNRLIVGILRYHS
jgi:hypothetical protein